MLIGRSGLSHAAGRPPNMPRGVKHYISYVHRCAGPFSYPNPDALETRKILVLTTEV